MPHSLFFKLEMHFQAELKFTMPFPELHCITNRIPKLKTQLLLLKRESKIESNECIDTLDVINERMYTLIYLKVPY